MNRLQKFIEQGAYGEQSGSVVFAFGLNKLPPPAAGMEWRLDAAFNAAEEVFRAPGLKDVFKAWMLDHPMKCSPCAELPVALRRYGASRTSGYVPVQVDID
jgi:hypothetical protein